MPRQICTQQQETKEWNSTSTSSIIRSIGFNNISHCTFVTFCKRSIYSDLSRRFVVKKVERNSTDYIYKQRRYYSRDFVVQFFHIQHNEYENLEKSFFFRLILTRSIHFLENQKYRSSYFLYYSNDLLQFHLNFTQLTF